MQTGLVICYNNKLNTSYPVSVNLKVDGKPAAEASDLHRIATIEDSLEELKELKEEKHAIDQDLENLQKSLKVKLATKIERYILPILGTTVLGSLGIIFVGGAMIAGGMLSATLCA